LCFSVAQVPGEGRLFNSRELQQELRILLFSTEAGVNGNWTITIRMKSVYQKDMMRTGTELNKKQ